MTKRIMMDPGSDGIHLLYEELTTTKPKFLLQIKSDASERHIHRDGKWEFSILLTIFGIVRD